MHQTPSKINAILPYMVNAIITAYEENGKMKNPEHTRCESPSCNENDVISRIKKLIILPSVISASPKQLGHKHWC